MAPVGSPEDMIKLGLRSNSKTKAFRKYETHS